MKHYLFEYIWQFIPVITKMLIIIFFEKTDTWAEEQTGAKITRKLQTDKTDVMVQTQLKAKLVYSTEVELEGN